MWCRRWCWLLFGLAACSSGGGGGPVRIADLAEPPDFAGAVDLRVETPVDLAMPRGIYFRTLFRTLLDTLRGSECQRLAQVFGGYEFSDLGNVVWAA